MLVFKGGTSAGKIQPALTLVPQSLHVDQLQQNLAQVFASYFSLLPLHCQDNKSQPVFVPFSVVFSTGIEEAGFGMFSTGIGAATSALILFDLAAL